MIIKYIIIAENNSPILFEKQVLHSEVAKPFGAIKSAGFCTISFKKNKLKIKCFGESSSLKIKSNPEEDEDQIRISFFLPRPTTPKKMNPALSFMP